MLLVSIERGEGEATDLSLSSCRGVDLPNANGAPVLHTISDELVDLNGGGTPDHSFVVKGEALQVPH